MELIHGPAILGDFSCQTLYRCVSKDDLNELRNWCAKYGIGRELMPHEIKRIENPDIAACHGVNRDWGLPFGVNIESNEIKEFYSAPESNDLATLTRYKHTSDVEVWLSAVEPGTIKKFLQENPALGR